MMYNNNSDNADATAWGPASEFNYIFNIIHHQISSSLHQMIKNNSEGDQDIQRAKVVIRGHPSDIERLWNCLNPNDSCITKKWCFEIPDVEVSTRKHSATIFRSAEQWVHFVQYDRRLIYAQNDQKASFYLPLKRLDLSLICPPGTYDPTNLLGSHETKIVNYQVWCDDMATENPEIRILQSCNNADIQNLRQLAVFPIQIVHAQNASYQTVFVPAFEGRESARYGCKSYTLGSLLFGFYEIGNGFDLSLRGYLFAIPINMVKAETSEPFFLRTCRHFKKLNPDSDSLIPLDGNATFYLKPYVLNKRTSKLNVTHAETAGLFNLSTQQNCYCANN